MKATMTLEEAVWVDPDRMSGAPCFRGSRLPVQQVLRAAGVETPYETRPADTGT